MVVKTLLTGMKFEGTVSVRRKTKEWFDYIGGGSPAHVIYRYAYYEIVSSCIIDGILILYVE